MSARDDQQEEDYVSRELSRAMVYSSPSISARRRRILREARTMIAEEGVERFAIRELCRRAAVAQRTLYNAFQSKDRIIALAIREAYDGVNQRIRYKTPSDTLEGYLDRLLSVHQRNFRARNYTLAVTALYFSKDVPPDIFEALQSMGIQNLRIWLNAIANRKEFADWVIVPELEANFINLQFATTHDWSRGRIADEQYLRRLCEGVLLIAIGATTGSTRKDAINVIDALRATGKLPKFPQPSFLPVE